MRAQWRIDRDNEADALYIYTAQPTGAEAAPPSVARSRQVAAEPVEVLADFSADHHLLGIEILHPGCLRPLYLYRQPHQHPQHRPHHGAPAGPGSQGDGVVGAGERLLGKVVKWRRGHSPT